MDNNKPNPKSEPKSERVCERIVFAEKRRKALELREDLKVILSRVELEHNNFLALFDGKEEDNPHKLSCEPPIPEVVTESENESENDEEEQANQDFFENQDIFFESEEKDNFQDVDIKIEGAEQMTIRLIKTD